MRSRRLPSRHLLRRVTSLSGAAALLVTATACGSGGSGSGFDASPSAGQPAAGLQELYSQKLDWKSCHEGECAWLKVPLDYAKPSGPTINIAVNRMKAKGTKRGSLVVNPGGPGGSGVDYAAAADQIVTAKVRQHYDIVGFDPRGVQRSAAITCLDDAQLDASLGSDPAPSNPAQESAYLAQAKQTGAACAKNAGPLLGHVSTGEAAKDMDILRAALGEKKLDYLGKSYGTLLGSRYADQFPKNVGRMVLDGVLPPDLTMEQVNEGQAKGFERALDSYLDDCLGKGNCPLGSNRDAAKSTLKKWLNSVDSAHIAVKGDARINRLTEGWAVNGLGQGLYEPGLWPTLTSALKSAMSGDGTALMKMADEYASRNSDGTYSGNIMQVINAVTCLDGPAPGTSASVYEKAAKRFSAEAPTWGTQLAWAGATCASWPVKPTNTPHRVTAAGSAPILVVGTTRDPATPYEWSKRLVGELQNARLVSFDGDGHTAYFRGDDGSSCVDRTVDGYLVDGTVPRGDTSC